MSWFSKVFDFNVRVCLLNLISRIQEPQGGLLICIGSQQAEFCSITSLLASTTYLIQAVAVTSTSKLPGDNPAKLSGGSITRYPSCYQTWCHTHNIRSVCVKIQPITGKIITLPHDFLVSAILWRASVIHLFLKAARKVEEASNSVFIQLIEQGGCNVFASSSPVDVKVASTGDDWGYSSG
jgi:hypothetical protein